MYIAKVAGIVIKKTPIISWFIYLLGGLIHLLGAVYLFIRGFNSFIGGFKSLSTLHASYLDRLHMRQISTDTFLSRGN